MLIAKNQEGNLVSALETSLQRKEPYSCPGCQGIVLLRHGQVMCPHFAHKSLQDCQFFSENESAQHLSLKAALYKSLVNHGEKVSIEKVLSEMGQIADLFVGDFLALEVQCSRLSQQRLRERTCAYHQAGYEVRWLLGEELWLNGRLTDLQRDFLYFTAKIGFHLWELDWKREEIRLKYLIYEDIFGKVYYLTKTWPLTENLMAVLRFPYQVEKGETYKVTQRKKVSHVIQRELMGKNPRWLRRQEEAYLKGMNLLCLSDQDFFPQVRFPESKQGFVQIRLSIDGFEKLFMQYYRKRHFSYKQTLYPPTFYAKIVKNRHN
ncbi:competence protein CoiA [Streptococcus vestibularis]|uniref:Competence protein CoiA-like family protein n=1 Tax=Streptococcus vestibularis TaxID=1343 RepID=A0A564TA09_STRVE|nr:competence protein CoiA family protein [Streptococcus vestibularis]VUX04265.1 Competence protein CoiA-like family protein [Streptococcus vestibularis]